MCLIGDMLADGPDGPHRMDEVQAGYRVWSNADGRLAAQAVTASWLSRHQEVFEVRFTKGRSVTASANHPFLVVRRTGEKRVIRDAGDWLPELSARQRQGARGIDPCSLSTCEDRVWQRNLCIKHYQRFMKHGDPRIHGDRREAWEPTWVRLDELREGDLVVRTMETPDVGSLVTLPDGTEVTPDVAWLIGMILGDGNVAAGHRVRLSVYDPELCQRIRSVWENLTGRLPREYPYPAPMYLNSATFTIALEQLGLCVLGPQKQVPADVWRWPRTLQEAFLEGYGDADGCRTKVAVCEYASASHALVAGIRAMHIAHGDNVSNLTARRRSTGPGAFAGSKPSWAFAVYQRNRNLGPLKEKMGLTALWASWNGRFGLVRVQRVIPRDAHDTYDITVDGSHGFSVDGIHVHNCGRHGGRKTVGPSVGGMQEVSTRDPRSAVMAAGG
jgi:hypothetical protein